MYHITASTVAPNVFYIRMYSPQPMIIRINIPADDMITMYIRLTGCPFTVNHMRTEGNILLYITISKTLYLCQYLMETITCH